MASHRYFSLPGINPEPWAIGPLGVNNRGGKPRPYIGPNSALVNYQNAIKNELNRQHVTKLVTIECDVTFYFWRRLDRYVTASDRTAANHIADATNLQKGLEDALQGVLITNDRLVQVVTSEIVEQTPETKPGIIIVLKTPHQPSGLLGVPGDLLRSFNDERLHADEFDLSDNII